MKKIIFSLKVLHQKFPWVSINTICCPCLGYAVKIIILNVYRTNCKKMFTLIVWSCYIWCGDLKGKCHCGLWAVKSSGVPLLTHYKFCCSVVAWLLVRFMRPCPSNGITFDETFLPLLTYGPAPELASDASIGANQC